MNKVEVGCVIKLRASTRKLDKLRYDRKYIVTKMSPDLRDLITQVEDQFGNPINLKMDTDYFDIVWSSEKEDKPKRYSIGDKVISTRDTPEVPEGFVGYVVEKPSNSCNDYEYAVEQELSVGKIEYFNEEELELLTTATRTASIARPILEERKIGKVQMNLFDEGFPNAVMEVAKVMTWAAENKGYKPHDWVNLPDAESSFPSAASRHRVKSLIQKVSGLPVSGCVDEESGILHKAHEAFNILAELELLLRGKIK